MGYDGRRTTVYGYTGIDLHTADITKTVKGPAGQTGRFIDAEASVTTTTAGGTTTPIVQVGLVGALTTYCNLPVGVVTAPNSVRASGVAGAIATIAAANTVGPVIPADTLVYFTFKAATGGGAAGVADVFISIDWGLTG